jgi:Tfp pilus assembly protein PilF
VRTLLFLLLLPPAAYARAGDDGLRSYICSEPYAPFFAAEPQPDGSVLMVPKRRGSAAPVFRVPNRDGRRRIFVAGESAAGLLSAVDDDGRDPLVRAAERLVPEGPGVEGVNCGMGGYDSERILRVVREVARYGPAEIVVLSGNNEGVADDCPGLRARLRRGLREAEERLRSLFSDARAVRHAMRLERHERNLRRMARAARRAGVRLAFCTLPVDLRDVPPSSPPYPASAGHFAARAAAERGELRTARGLLETLLRHDPLDAHAHYALARLLERLGESAPAAEHYRRAVEWDPSAGRATPRMNEALRRVAREEGACLADLESLFASAPDARSFSDGVHWLPSRTPAVDEAVLGALAACAGRAAPVRPPALPAGPAPPAPATARRLLLNALRVLQTARGGGDGDIDEAALAYLRRSDALDRERLERAASSRAGLEGALEENFFVRGLREDADRLRLALLRHLGELRRRQRALPAALRLTDEALRLDPGARATQAQRALILAAIGRRKEAEDAFETLIAGPDMRQDRGAELLALARAYGLTPRPERAAAARRSAKALSDEGVRLLRSGDARAAETAFSAALRAEPRSMEAHLNLCAALTRAGRRQESLERCTQAVRTAEGAPILREQDRSFLPSALAARARARRLAGDPQGAAVDLRAALRSAPRDWPESAAVRRELEALER